MPRTDQGLLSLDSTLVSSPGTRQNDLVILEGCLLIKSWQLTCLGASASLRHSFVKNSLTYYYLSYPLSFSHPVFRLFGARLIFESNKIIPRF